MGHRLSKIVTRTGDDGTTGLGDGSRVRKDTLRIEAMGSVDELNCALGVLLSAGVPNAAAADCLIEIQHDLFDLGGELAIPGTQAIDVERVAWLEQQIEQFNAELPALKEFVLPGGGTAASASHLARAVSRPSGAAGRLRTASQSVLSCCATSIGSRICCSYSRAFSRAPSVAASRCGIVSAATRPTTACRRAAQTSSARSRGHSKATPGSLLRPGAMSLWPTTCSRLSDGYAPHKALMSAASATYCASA